MMKAQHPLDRFTTSTWTIPNEIIGSSFDFDRASQTYGFQQIPFDQMKEDECGVAIGNDVWIGQEVLFKQNVTIGNGAVIAARSVVTKDVPPYAIVAGAPAKVVRYRYTPEIIEELLELEWWNYPMEKFSGICADELIESFIKKLKHKIVTKEIHLMLPEKIRGWQLINQVQ